MSERISRQQHTFTGRTIDVRDYWQATGPGVAVLWTEYRYSDGQPSETTGPRGMVIYQAIDFELLRGIPLSKMQPHRSGFPEFDQDEPPTADQLFAAWKAKAGVRTRAERKVESSPVFAPRMEGESADEFYVRVAAFYTTRQAVTGEPTKDLVDATGLPKTTAARWVREARARGHLAPTTRGKGRA